MLKNIQRISKICNFVSVNNKRYNIMTTLETLIQERKDLQIAFKNGHLTVNEYSDFVYAISQRIRKLGGE